VSIVPTTPATTVAVTYVPNSLTIATTMKPPERSIEPNVTRKLPACRPGPANPHAAIESMLAGNAALRMFADCLMVSSRRRLVGWARALAQAVARVAIAPRERTRSIAAAPAASIVEKFYRFSCVSCESGIF
jgi:hypothetical protein